MSIKPNDCVIKLKDLVVERKRVFDQYGEIYDQENYVNYWTNFLKHVSETTDRELGWNAYDKNMSAQLAKFNAIYKETKKPEDRYIKFKTHKDLTLFVLKWSWEC